MTRLIATRGLPGSGKTTWARGQSFPGKTVRVNRDDMELMLHGPDGLFKKTGKVTRALQDVVISAALKQGLDVVVDDTNLAPQRMTRLTELAEEAGAHLVWQHFTDVPLETCIKRDLQRTKSVGEAVIRRMYRDFLAPTLDTYDPDPKLPRVAICDIDGTLVIKCDRDIFDYSRVEVDKPNLPIVRLVQVLAYDRDIIFMSGRDDACFEQTRNWLVEHLGYAYPESVELYMRKTGDKRKDAIVKRELFDKHIRDQYQVDYVIDDRNSVVEMWRSLGLTVLQVADGDF